MLTVVAAAQEIDQNREAALPKGWISSDILPTKNKYGYLTCTGKDIYYMCNKDILYKLTIDNYRSDGTKPTKRCGYKPVLASKLPTSFKYEALCSCRENGIKSDERAGVCKFRVYFDDKPSEKTCDLSYLYLMWNEAQINDKYKKNIDYTYITMRPIAANWMESADERNYLWQLCEDKYGSLSWETDSPYSDAEDKAFEIAHGFSKYGPYRKISTDAEKMNVYESQKKSEQWKLGMARWWAGLWGGY